MKDYWTDTLRRREKADEDRYFAEQDRKLIEQWRRQRQQSQNTSPPAAMEAPADREPPEPDSIGP